MRLLRDGKCDSLPRFAAFTEDVREFKFEGRNVVHHLAKKVKHTSTPSPRSDAIAHKASDLEALVQDGISRNSC